MKKQGTTDAKRAAANDKPDNGKDRLAVLVWGESGRGMW